MRENSVDLLQGIRIPEAQAPLITPIISSISFYNSHEEVICNKYQKFILEGKYQEEWKHCLPQEDWKGILPVEDIVTRI